MYRILFTSVLSTLTLFVAAQNYNPADEGSKVHFAIKNFGINTGGDLSGLKGNIYFDPANLPASNFTVSVEVKTIDTDSENRDEHLRGDRYFDADKYPEILIKSVRIDKANSGKFNFTGTLTMHGITKNITFPFTASLQGSDYLFSGDFEINRLDYSVGEESSVLSNTVKISLSVLAKKE